MGEILEFPSQQAQGLAYLDRQLRSMLDAKGADQALIDFAATQLTQIYAQFTCKLAHARTGIGLYKIGFVYLS